MISKLMFKLCPIHRKCAQSCLDMAPPLCNIKRCLAQTTRIANEAYWKTITQRVLEEKTNILNKIGEDRIYIAKMSGRFPDYIILNKASRKKLFIDRNLAYSYCFPSKEKQLTLFGMPVLIIDEMRPMDELNKDFFEFAYKDTY